MEEAIIYLKKMRGDKIFLSKSNYVKGLQCQKALWFFNYRKDLKPALNDKTEAKFETGNEITELARKYFEEGVEAADDYFDIENAVASTKDLIEKGHDIIFEATAIIESDNSHARIDILRKSQNSDGWDLIEVKGSTGVKESHLNDLSFQYHVFSKANYQIDSCLLMLLDGEYILNGELDLGKLFKFEDVTEAILEKQVEVESCKFDLLKVLGNKIEPKVKIGVQCFEKQNHHYECDYKHYCWSDIPSYSVFDVCHRNKTAEKIVDQINSYKIEDIKIEDFPKGLKTIDVECYQENKTHIDQPKIKEWLNELQYPLFFLDYETFQSAVPIFNGTRPYQQIPFQFSLHIQETPDSEPKHFEFLHQERSDPRGELVKKLVEVCEGEGSVICYNQTFEKCRNIELAADFPQYAGSLNKINERMVDLWKPFKDRLIYSPKQQGSASIKDVLPAFTSLNYNEMEIANGGEAMEIYLNFIKGKEVDKVKMIDDLLSYCKLDTYAMVELVRVLRQ